MEKLDEHSREVKLDYSKYNCSVSGQMKMRVLYKFSLLRRETSSLFLFIKDNSYIRQDDQKCKNLEYS
jgi:hypothetical protein